ncbi:MAG TPA: YhgE/Pip domain-containing protein [Bacillota bacterium]|nr:YhgE/Pip domain-containing protein [Bacillota bacterium]
MKNSWHIFTQDMKNIGKNWVVLVILGGLVFLPSLYAWLNIKASWDPYGQTDQIPVGVVNEDTGETVRDQRIDVGNDLVETLKENDSMKWKFMDKRDAMDQLEKGDLFAVILIPENFSKNLGTVIQSNPQKANVEYYVNEKINAIAPKITEKGASVIVEDISSEFVSTVNGIIFEVFNDIGLEIEEEMPNIEQFEDYLFTIEEKLPEIHETLISTLSDAEEAQTIVRKAQNKMPEVETAVQSGLDTIDETNAFLEEAEKELEQLGPRIKEELDLAQDTVSSIHGFIEEVEEAGIDFSEGEAIQERIEEQINASLESLQTIQDILEAVVEQMENEEDPNEEALETLKAALVDLEELTTTLEEGKSEVDNIAAFLEEKKAEVEDVLAHVKNVVTDVEQALQTFSEIYNQRIEPFVLEQFAQAKATIADARSMVTEIQNTLPSVKELLNRTDGSLTDGKELLNEVLGEYPYINDKVTELADRVRSAQEDVDLQEVIELLQNDPEAERGFFAEPVTLTEHSLFPIQNYGTGMTPFYTVLSLWVGGLLLISLLATEYSVDASFRPREVYFGKLFLFTLLGALQASIVTLGDLFIIQVDIAHPVWFVVFGLFCSLVFILIIYTFVSVFGDVGKALAIVMLVLQIAGSGGTYPVALLPKFFQTISPFLPFTYAVELMREAVGGIVWSNALIDVLVLSIFVMLIVLFGTFLKEPINKNFEKVLEKSKNAGIFH